MFNGILDVLSEVGGVDILHIQHEYGIFGRGQGIIDVAIEAREEGLAGRIVFTLHTVYRSPGGVEAGVQERVLSEADAVIVHSVVQELELHAEHGGYPRNLYRIPHGTMVNPYLGHPRMALARRLGLGVDVLERFTIALPGFLRPDKGVDVLLAALEQVSDPRLSVIVAGEPRDSRLLGLLESVRDKVRVIPRYLSTSEILMLTALSNLIILPYRDPPGKYAVSGVLHLSMGSMKPVIGSNTPRLSELYTLAPRLVFRAGDPEDLARLLNTILSPGYYDIIIPYAAPLYSYAVRTSWNRVASRHIELYRRILNNTK